MIKFEDNYFQKFDFSRKQVKKYLDSARKDLKIAKESDIVDVRFQFSYNSLIKLGVALIACHGYKVRARVGHHVKILEKISEMLNDENILIYGNQMRKTRNTELYDGGIIITDKRAEEYFDFVLRLADSSGGILKKYLDALL